MKKSELAKAIGITQPTINAWYTKGYENVSLSTLIRIASLFNVTIEELVHGEDLGIHFSEKDYSKAELEMIAKFSEFVKTTRKE